MVRARRGALDVGLLVLVLLAGVVVVYLQRYRLGLDGVAYLSIAQRWLDGEVVRNAYWGPLTSWLAVPLLAVGLPPVVAGHVVVLGAALVTVVLVRVMGGRLQASAGPDIGGSVSSAGAALVLVPTLLAAISYGVFPDLLVGAVCLALVLVLDGPWWARPWRGAAAGALVAVGLWTKITGLALAVGLVLVAVVLGVLATRTNWMGPHPEASGPDAGGWHGAASLVAVAAVLLGGWAVVLAPANGGPTLSSATAYNAALLEPDVRGAPVLVDGLVEPPAPGAVSAWDDPAAYPITVQTRDVAGEQVVTPEPVSSSTVQRIRANLGEVWRLLGEILPLPLGVAGLLVALRDPTRRRTALLLLAGVGGALLVVVVGVVELRYLWPATLLAAPGAAVLLDLLRARWQQAAAVVLLAVVVAAPLADGVLLRADAGEQTRATARTLVDEGISGGRVASSNRFQRSALVCLHADCTFLGRVRGDTPAEVRASLDEFDVGWLLVWQPNDRALPTGVEEVGAFGEVAVYRLPDSSS